MQKFLITLGFLFTASSSYAATESDALKACFHEKDAIEFFNKEASISNGIMIKLTDKDAQTFITAFNAEPPASEFKADHVLIVASNKLSVDGKPVENALIRFVENDTTCGTIITPTKTLVEIMTKAFKNRDSDKDQNGKDGSI